jgi:hypothetical protein
MGSATRQQQQEIWILIKYMHTARGSDDLVVHDNGTSALAIPVHLRIHTSYHIMTDRKRKDVGWVCLRQAWQGRDEYVDFYILDHVISYLEFTREDPSHYR